MDGGVRKEGDRIRITARLLETNTGRQVWAERYDRKIDDIKEAQQMFEETMRSEPESSFGYALAAWAHWWSIDQGLSEDTALSLERAVELARKAEDLEDYTGLHIGYAQSSIYVGPDVHIIIEKS